MPILSFEVEFTGRPLVEFYVTIGTTLAETFRDDGRPIPGPIYVKALVDTGAMGSHVDLSLLSSLGLDLEGEIDVYTASTGAVPEKMNTYTIDLHLAGDKPGCIARDLEVIGSNRLAGLKVGMLLGRDILDRCLLVYDGPHRRFTLAYDAPETRPED